MEAVRNMPYGIQQPAVSGQLLQLESHLGVKLFRRRPFELLPAGTELYEFIHPFFGGLGGMEKRLRSASRETLRVAAPVVALRDHLPRVLQEVRKHFPHLQLTLRAGQQPQVEAWLERQELDFAITLLEGQGAKGLQHLPLLELPLVLLVPKTSRFTGDGEPGRPTDFHHRYRIGSPTLPGISREPLAGMAFPGRSHRFGTGGGLRPKRIRNRPGSGHTRKLYRQGSEDAAHHRHPPSASGSSLARGPYCSDEHTHRNSEIPCPKDHGNPSTPGRNPVDPVEPLIRGSTGDTVAV